MLENLNLSTLCLAPEETPIDITLKSVQGNSCVGITFNNNDVEFVLGVTDDSRDKPTLFLFDKKFTIFRTTIPNDALNDSSKFEGCKFEITGCCTRPQ